MADLNALQQANAKRWASAKLTRKTEAANIALHLYQAKKRYQAVEARTGVPWAVIAVIHERESSQNFNTQLGQGDPLNRVSVHVPAGRGPFSTWEDGAYDALVLCPPFLAKRKDWSLGGTLLALEMYNGIGYAARGVPSPYVWAGTDQYSAGKFVADGKYDPSKVDAQMGCAALLMALMAMDATITFTGAKLTPVAPSKPVQPPAQSPSPASFWGAVLSIILNIFRRK
jgi:lysozyme family protein